MTLEDQCSTQETFSMSIYWPYDWEDCDGNITEYVVGMEAKGGIIFYVDETGNTDWSLLWKI